MSNELSTQVNPIIIQELVLRGDLSMMNGAQKVEYYNKFCQALGLNPLTQPFQIIKFQGKEKLYATKDCTEQLRKIHGVGITDVTSTQLNGVFIVTAKAVDKTGKLDAATGAVNIEGLKGENLANALMKAETKAKRRVTLSICGLGILDEAELDTMPPHTVEIIDEVGDENRDWLLQLVESSTYDERQRTGLKAKIPGINTLEGFDKAKAALEANQMDMDGVINPSQTDIKKKIKAIAG